MSMRQNNHFRYLLLLMLLGCTLCCLADSIPERAYDDSVSYEQPPIKNFNALQYSLDTRHRYKGDTMATRSTFLDFGAGIVMLKHQNTGHAEPITNLHLNIGRQFSPLHSARIGLSGGIGYLPSGVDGDGPETLMSMIGGEADYLFSLSNYLLGYRPERPLDVSTVLGVGFYQYKIGGGNNQKTAEGLELSSSSYLFHAGLQLKFFAGPKAALALEPYVTLSKPGADLADLGTNWHKYYFSYGLHLSYIYYFNNRLTPPALQGVFKKRYGAGSRWFKGDKGDRNQRRPLFVFYGAGAAEFNTFSDELEVSKTLGPSMGVGIGAWLSSALALRSSFNIAHSGWSRFGSRMNMMTYTSASIDAVLNPLGFVRNYNWEAPAGFNLFAGYELGFLQVIPTGDNINSYAMGYRLGLQPWVRLGRDTRLFIEPTYTVMRYSTGADNRKRADQYALKIGVEMMIGGPREAVSTDNEKISPSGFFVGAGLGWNTAFRRWKYDILNDDFLKNGLFFGGYHFDPYSGIMLSAEHMVDKISSIETETKFKNWLVSLDYQLNLTNLLTGYNPYRRWTFSMLAGPTLGINSDHTYFGGNVGVQLDYKITKHIGLFYQHRFYWTSRYLFEHSRFYDEAGAIKTSFNIGLMYSFDDLVGPVTYLAKGAAKGVGHAASFVGRSVGTAASFTAKGIGAASKAVAHGVGVAVRGIGKGVSSVARGIGHGVGSLFKKKKRSQEKE